MQLLMKMKPEMKIKRKKLFNLNEEICIEGTDSKLKKIVLVVNLDHVTRS